MPQNAQNLVRIIRTDHQQLFGMRSHKLHKRVIKIIFRRYGLNRHHQVLCNDQILKSFLEDNRPRVIPVNGTDQQTIFVMYGERLYAGPE